MFPFLPCMRGCSGQHLIDCELLEDRDQGLFASGSLGPGTAPIPESFLNKCQLGGMEWKCSNYTNLEYFNQIFSRTPCIF